MQHLVWSNFLLQGNNFRSNLKVKNKVIF